MKTLSEVQE